MEPRIKCISLDCYQGINKSKHQIKQNKRDLQLNTLESSDDGPVCRSGSPGPICSYPPPLLDVPFVYDIFTTVKGLENQRIY